MGITTADITGIKIGNQDVSGIYFGTEKIRPTSYPTESIVYKITADSSGNIYVPTAGTNHSSYSYTTYDWNVSIDGGATTNYTGTGASGSSITLTGYTADTDHVVMITPTTEDYSWAVCYGWYDTVGRTYLKEILYDGSYMGYGVSETDAGSFFRYRQYRGCTGITEAPAEVFPNTVTTIGTYFRADQFYACTSLVSAPEEVMSSGLTSMGQYFRTQQYMSCTALEEIKGWLDTSTGAGYYRQKMFYGASESKTVKVINDVGYASYSSDSLQNSYVTTVSVPSAYLSNYTGSTKEPRKSITDSKFEGY